MSTINQRLSVVRRREEVSIRCMANRLGIPIVEYELWESVAHELTVNQLLACQKALNVPLTELLGAADPFVRDRVSLLRAYKSARSLSDLCDDLERKVMVDRLLTDLRRVMPELGGQDAVQNHEVGSWPIVGHRRTLDEASRREEFPVATEFFSEAPSFANTF